jgi:hypothetical protein
MCSVLFVGFLFSGIYKTISSSHIFLPPRCLPSQYLTLINYPIKRLYIITSVVIFLLGMFIYRGTHNQQKILEKSYKKNIKPSVFSIGLISLTSSYWFLCRHPYYLGIFNYIFQD